LGAVCSGALACDGEAASCEDGDPPRVVVTNMTGNAFAEIEIRACDGSELESYPLPPPGLADGDEHTLELPAPGCWMLTYSGEGCFNDPVFQTEACAGETIAWDAGSDAHVCQG